MNNNLTYLFIAESTQIFKPRQRRSIVQYDRVSRKHIETKAILLLSLGNAGKQRSLNHIKSYLVPNKGTSVWRRAAANSLRHFNCNEVKHVKRNVLKWLKGPNESNVHVSDGIRKHNNFITY